MAYEKKGWTVSVNNRLADTKVKNKMEKENSTYNACHGQSLLKVAQKHFSLVKHLCGFMISFLGMNEDGAEKKRQLILQPQLLKSAN